MNYKYDRPRPVTIESLDAGRRYHLAEFEALLPSDDVNTITALPQPRLVRSITDRDRVLRRARKYLAAIPGAIQGNHGDQSTFKAACKLVNDFALTESEALTLLQEWNATCVPPWSERELEEKIANAVKYASGPTGSKLEEHDRTTRSPGDSAAPVRLETSVNELLTAVESFIRAYVVLTPEQSAITTLFVGLTHAIKAFDYTPYLRINSPMPECGKTRLLEVLEATVANPWLTGRVTAAVLMRKVDAEHPTLLLDESDAAFGGDKEYAEALRGLLNSGFHRSGKSSACTGQGANISYKDFETFCPKAIAGIDRLPSTVESRSIPITLKRRTKGDTIAKWRRRDAWATAEPLRDQLAAMGREAHEALRSARSVFPEGLSDRAEDVLEPLFAIANMAGGDWPRRAREAAVALMGHEARNTQEADQHVGLELLADIAAIFGRKHNPEKLPTKELIEALVALDDRP